MRLAFVIDSLYNSGGMEHSMSIVAGALTSKYDVTVITGLQNKRELFYPLSPKITYVDISVDPNLKKKHLFEMPIINDYRKKLEKYLFEHRMDYVVSLGGITQYFLYKIKDGSKKILWFKFEINIFKVWATGNPIKVLCETTFQKYRMIYHISKFDKIVLLTDSDLKQWRNYTNRAVRIYNPLTLDVPLQISDLSNKQVIAVGRLTKVKGFDFLIDAWGKVNKEHPDWELVIYGDGEERSNLQRQIENLGLSSVIQMPGRTKELVSKYAASSIFILTSREEGFGNVMIEAEACGLPIIAFDCPYGPREIIRNEYNGYLIPKIGDVDTLSEKIIKLISDSTLRKKIGNNALKDVKRFSVDKICNEWVQLLSTI
ncbi:glycosyltransferase family 4 protein [Hoylesella buccalis]|uniref:Glycosyl transferase family 1 domain-containing protein n=1 Tax=Hoylesella buccalis DNF00853 TaxID=1401074 RepID=A0A095ZQI1_9BACT|nr:glycosyltransferase family 4 protein [Hoylesella buccalis]KGF36656.1 hypothetical protein HMPREF2137_01275 [Hoylesella buccalis DNF00853]